MYDFNINLECTPSKSFRVARIMADFDVKQDHCKAQLSGEIETPQQWNIGVIVGPSGTGKTTIAKNIFPDILLGDFQYSGDSVVDDMPEHCTMDEIEKMFYSVGFGSVPSWLKPYSVLSNGEKMRVDLANALLRSDNVAFDEFTSVVDRNVAKTCCVAVEKAVRRADKRFIAISCHYDILEFLKPDWVFDTAKMQGFFGTSLDRKEDFPSGNAEEASGTYLGDIII